MEQHCGARSEDRYGSCCAGRAAHHGRRADFRFPRRSGRRRVDQRRARTQEAKAGGRAAPEAAGPLRSGALLHFGQGKWYPGELLPRWALGCYWRKDGVAIWENPELIADENTEYGYTAEDARRFLEALTRRLQVNASFIMTAYEDAFLLHLERAQAAGQRRPARFETRQSDRSRANGARFRTRLRRCRRLCSSAAADSVKARAPLDQPAVVPGCDGTFF